MFPDVTPAGFGAGQTAAVSKTSIFRPRLLFVSRGLEKHILPGWLEPVQWLGGDLLLVRVDGQCLVYALDTEELIGRLATGEWRDLQSGGPAGTVVLFTDDGSAHLGRVKME